MKCADFEPNRLEPMTQSGRDRFDLPGQRQMWLKGSLVQHESSFTETACEPLRQRLQ